MTWLEPSCLAIVALYVVTRALVGPDTRRFLRRLALLIVASWMAENSVIHAYGFYFYKPVWSIFVDQVPLMIVLIWPIVILSAHDLAIRLVTGSAMHLGIVTGAFVFADAWLIEPIAVQSGLWAWTEPGLFNVPPIGVLGWAFFAALCMAFLKNNEGRNPSVLHELKILVIAPIGTHLLLLCSWWGALRWVNHTLPQWPLVGLAWLISIALSIYAIRCRAGRKVSLALMLTRVPAAAFFFVLLGLFASHQAALLAFAIAFVPPYLAITPFSAPQTA
jgi:hypothetical protein